MNKENKICKDIQNYVLMIEHLWVQACIKAYNDGNWTQADVLKDEAARAGRKLYERINK